MDIIIYLIILFIIIALFIFSLSNSQLPSWKTSEKNN
jgi:biopolymer transport protein ExbD